MQGLNAFPELDGGATFTVTEFNRFFRDLVRGSEVLQDLKVSGEVSDHIHHTSGHHYFTLRDAGSSLRCAMFRNNSEGGRFLEDGSRVVAFGKADYYPPRGSFQLIVAQIEPAGVGGLRLKLERLRKQLSSEGLFDTARKRALPRFPATIAVVSSPTGAVQEDISTTLARRWPLARMVLIPVNVQGEAAERSIVNGIKTVSRAGADVCIVARGGGSLEDLMAFNSEAVARAIFACDVPLVSAVGHETDTTVADEVADLRAATPTAAAELVSPNCVQLLEQIDSMHSTIGANLSTLFGRLDPDLQLLGDRLRDCEPLAVRGKRVVELSQRLRLSGTFFARVANGKIDALSDRLEALSPIAVLERGYAVVYKHGKLIGKPSQFARGDKINIQLAHGKVGATVNEVS